MDDDLDTAEALFRLRQMTEALDGLVGLSADEGRAIANVYRECGQVLGLFEDLA